jgi:hypothetical protein
VEADRTAGEELELDPRAIARASLAAGRNASLWVVALGVLVATAVALWAGAPAGALVLAAMLIGGAVARVALPSPGPVAFTVRSRSVDVTVLLLLAAGLGVLAPLVAFAS